MKITFATLKMISACSLLIALSSCSKDKDLDDYVTERLQSDLAEFKAVEGTYTGYLVSAKDSNVNLGSLKVTLTATTQTSNSSDGSRSTAQPILVSEVEFQGYYQMNIVGQNSLYIPETGQFHTDIPVQVVNGNGQLTTETIALAGTIAEASISGSMQVRGHSADAGVFTLRSNGPSLRDLNARRKPDSVTSRAPVLKTYVGTANGVAAGGQTTPVTMFVTNPPRDKFTEIYYLLYPNAEKLMQVSFTLKEGVPGATFPVATWDTLNGTLQARQDTNNLNNGSIVTVTLSCKNFQFQDTQYNFTCDFSSTLRATNILFSFLRK